MIVFAHVSDIHLDLGKRAWERTARVMGYLDGLPGKLDAVVVTGDLADHGLAGEYEQVAKVLVGRVPVLICPGNHDVRSAYREVLLGEAAGDAPVNRVHRVAGATFLMCDSTIPGQADGLLSDETLAWIDATLGEDDGPAFVAFHHPPQPLHIPWIDEYRQHGAHRLAAVLDRHPRVRALLCGHVHTPAVTTFAGRPLLVAPGVVSTIKLPWEDGDVDHDLPPAIAFHVLDDELRMTTHYRVVL
ncbi:MAG TPA: phosphodiesterase [Actinophytocola sp.]|uniref:phosphodiesterase n=1 Tax=Actinophytocola sp. TaxID=1872138 RepID=UPI002DBE7CA9|nr:phosphodiesterase [Actinophytocola sp.]HEU5473803.1 phosphodiesterase [Actinophytocola sp.]